jgi:peroxiredoxin
MTIRRRAALALFALFVSSQAAAEPSAHTDVVLRALDGSRLALAERLAAGPVLLDFWATWCRPCERSLPATQRLHERFREQGLTVIGISVDGPRNWARVRPFASRLGLGFPIVVDEDGSLARRFRVNGVPTTVLLAPDGRVARQHTGWVVGEDDSLAASVAELLRAKSTTPTP